MITVYIDCDPTEAIQTNTEINQINREEHTTTGEYYEGITNFFASICKKKKKIFV